MIVELDHVMEATLGTSSLVVTAFGAIVGQLDPSLGGAFVSVVTQFGGLGLAIWLVYIHTTKTIPDLQREHREEREAAIAQFTGELERKRQEYTASLNAMCVECHQKMMTSKDELKQVTEKLSEALKKGNS
jgi:hypothetical protein